MGSAEFDASATWAQCDSLPACESVMMILSANAIDVTVVRVSLTSPDVDLEGAGKGAG